MPIHLLLSMLIGFWTPAHAGPTPFRIINRTSDLDPNNAGEAAILAALNASADDIENQINTGILTEPKRQAFTGIISRANASNVSGVVGDRASNPKQFSAGLGFQGMFYSEGSNTASANNSLPSLGVGGQTTLLVGCPGNLLTFIPPGTVDLKRLMVFGNIMKFSTVANKVQVNMFNIGINASYKLILEGPPSVLAQFGGVSFGTGLNYSTNSITYAASLKYSSPVTVTTETATVNSDLDYTVGVASKNFFIPLEFSANVSLLYFFTFFGGFSLDINFGSSRMIGSASGPITAEYTGGSSVANLFSGSATVDLDDGVTGNPPTAMLRAFGGIQVNLSLLKLSMEYTWQGNGSQGVAAVIRFAM